MFKQQVLSRLHGNQGLPVFLNSGEKCNLHRQLVKLKRQSPGQETRRTSENKGCSEGRVERSKLTPVCPCSF